MLVRCLYASRITQPCPDNLLKDILDQSWHHNVETGVTGLLCHDSRLFIQVIEGGRDAVSQLLSTIMKDLRHHDVTLLLFEEIAERTFPTWTMGQINMAKLNSGVLLKYSTRPELDPFNMPGHATLALISELMANGAISK